MMQSTGDLRGPRSADRGKHDPVVSMQGIVKRFGSAVANDGVDFELAAGEIHALLGENGAGKSTLMNMLFGLFRPDEGRILVRGEPVTFGSPRDALAAGVGMVHQHFMLVPEFSVTENVVLGTRPALRRGFDRAALENEVGEVARRFGIAIDPSARIGDLSVDVQQQVEILKLLYRGAGVLILDEPTAVLGPAEIASLHDTLRGLREHGRSIVIITHKLGEVIDIADRVTVLRHGQVSSVAERGGFDQHSLAVAMIGRDLPEVPARPPRERIGQRVLHVEGLSVEGRHGEPVVSDVSFDIEHGEILGLVGVEGNGQVELIQSLCGLLAPARGTIRVDGDELAGTSPAAFHRARVGVVTEDRLTWDLVGELSVADNLALARVRVGDYARRGFLSPRRIERDAVPLLREFDVRPPDPRARAGALSGGNQQKLVLARELSREPRVLIASQPTRGLDVGAADFVYRQIADLRDRGCAILLNSTELDDLLALADRIAVIYRGRLALIADAGELTVDAAAHAMTGAAT